MNSAGEADNDIKPVDIVSVKGLTAGGDESSTSQIPKFCKRHEAEAGGKRDLGVWLGLDATAGGDEESVVTVPS
jgi:hypothetical protein